jgi:hypothetical protein
MLRLVQLLLLFLGLASDAALANSGGGADPDG